MEARVIEQGLKNQLPAIESFLKTILLKKLNVKFQLQALPILKWLWKP